MTIVGTILCIILLPVLVINVTLIVKSYVNTDEVPTLGGYCPMIVLTDSMFPEIEKGDLIICRTIDADKVKVGDVISISFGERTLAVEVLNVSETAQKSEAALLYREVAVQ